jgi:hypothetical protein
VKPSPRLYLAATPTTSASIPTIFRSGETRLLFENPPFTRHNGFNLVTYEQGRIDKGEKLTVGGDRKRLDLYPDGTFIAYATFPNFLGWPRGEAQFAEQPQINSLALVEFTYDFVQAYERILEYVEPQPERIRATIGLRNAQFDGKQLLLSPYGLGQYGYILREGASAPDSEVERTTEVEVRAEEPRIDVGATAFQLLEPLYHWFGLETDKIPYTTEDNTAIDGEAIRQA